MAIDFTKENVISLTEACKLLPQRRGGKRPHISTLYRWSSSGYRNVVLETIRVSGTLCTSSEALQRFFDRMTGLPAASRHTSHITRRAENASIELESQWSRSRRVNVADRGTDYAKG
jgi:hypothetical protein